MHLVFHDGNVQAATKRRHDTCAVCVLAWHESLSSRQEERVQGNGSPTLRWRDEVSPRSYRGPSSEQRCHQERSCDGGEPIKWQSPSVDDHDPSREAG